MKKTITFRKCPAKHLGSRRFGFTLVELLVVIGIIALLISILLPALSKARRAANTVVCAANMRSIALGMVMYAQQYHGAILGNASTSGAFLVNQSSISDKSTVGGINQVWDWTCPVAKVLGVKFDEGPTTGTVSPPTGRTGRFMQMSSYKPFMCPENDVIVSGSGTAITVAVPMISYVTSMYFQYGGYDPNSTTSAGTGVTQKFVDTGSYFPNITRVGDTGRKIFLADGAKWVQVNGNAPIYFLNWDGGGTPGGYYSDPGPWDSTYTRSYLPGTEMVLSMRHGDRTLPSLSGGQTINSSKMRMNVAFFDCHVEAIDGHAAMNPVLWLPRGSNLSTTEIPPAGEGYKAYMNPQTTMYIP